MPCRIVSAGHSTGRGVFPSRFSRREYAEHFASVVTPALLTACHSALLHCPPPRTSTQERRAGLSDRGRAGQGHLADTVQPINTGTTGETAAHTADVLGFGRGEPAGHLAQGGAEMCVLHIMTGGQALGHFPAVKRMIRSAGGG